MRRGLHLACLGALAWAAPGPGDMAHAPLAVVVHKSCPAETLSLADLRKMFTGVKREWADSHAVVIIEQPEEAESERRALQLLLRTTPSGYRRQLMEMQFQGKELPLIKVLNSDENAIKFVWSVPGAIAVVDAAAAAAAGARVKTLRVDGKKPGEAGYPLE